MAGGAGKLRRLTEWLNMQCLAFAAAGGTFPSAYVIAPFLEGSWEFSRIVAANWCIGSSTIEPEDVALQTYSEIERLMPGHATFLATTNIKYTTDLYKRTISNYYDLRRRKSEKLKPEIPERLDFIDSNARNPHQVLDASENLRTTVKNMTDDDIQLIWVTITEEFREILQPYLEGRLKLDPQLSIGELAAIKGR